MFDSAEGWVSMKGNQGKVFLEKTEKPFYHCLKDVVLQKDFTSGSADIRTIKAEEVMELLEGPRKEKLGSAMRLRGKASSDGKTGWFTMKDKLGEEFAKKNGKCYACTATVAITDNYDIKTCKVIKKLAVGEVFTVSEGPITEDATGIERVKGKSTKDDVEGWITTKGNAGTVYATVNEKLYVVVKEVALHSQFASSSSLVRNLAAQEAVEVLEGPREEKFLPAERVKVRTSDCSGWITVKADSARSWTPFYKFLKAASLYASKGVKESVVREVGVSEVIELHEGPVEIDGKMWMSGRMKKDGAIGWTAMKSEEGAKLLVQGGQ